MLYSQLIESPLTSFQTCVRNFVIVVLTPEMIRQTFSDFLRREMCFIFFPHFVRSFICTFVINCVIYRLITIMWIFERIEWGEPTREISFVWIVQAHACYGQKLRCASNIFSSTEKKKKTKNWSLDISDGEQSTAPPTNDNDIKRVFFFSFSGISINHFSSVVSAEWVPLWLCVSASLGFWACELNGKFYALFGKVIVSAALRNDLTVCWYKFKM